VKLPPLLLATALFLALLTRGDIVSARSFTSIEGVSIEAELIDVKDDQVTIRKDNGVEFTLPLTRFSDPDQTFIREWMAARPVPEEPPPPAGAPEPGSTLILEFPDLVPDRRDNPTTSTVKIPSDYDPKKKYPLVVWMGGGDGGDRPSSAIMPPGSYVVAGLPFPKGANNPHQANMVGDYHAVWAYWKTILDTLHERIPNLDKTRSVIGGFSNGGHAIDGVLRTPAKGKGRHLSDYFRVFIIADGGGTGLGGGKFPSLKDKFAYCCYGEKSPAVGIVQNLATQFKTSGATTKLNMMPESGHTFTPAERENVKEWMATVVLPVIAPAAAE